MIDYEPQKELWSDEDIARKIAEDRRLIDEARQDLERNGFLRAYFQRVMDRLRGPSVSAKGSLLGPF